MPQNNVSVTVQDQYIQIKDGAAAPYIIELFRCNTEEKILAWVLHLTEKTWVTCDIINEFIQLASERNNVTITRWL